MNLEKLHHSSVLRSSTSSNVPVWAISNKIVHKVKRGIHQDFVLIIITTLKRRSKFAFCGFHERFIYFELKYVPRLIMHYLWDASATLWIDQKFWESLWYVQSQSSSVYRSGRRIFIFQLRGSYQGNCRFLLGVLRVTKARIAEAITFAALDLFWVTPHERQVRGYNIRAQVGGFLSVRYLR